MEEHMKWRKANKPKTESATQHVEYAHADEYWHENIKQIRKEMDELTERLSYYLDMRAESHYHNVAVEVLNAKDPNELAQIAAKWDD